MSTDEVIKLLKTACAKAGSQKKWADIHNLSQPYVSDVLQGRRDPGASILDALNVEKIVVYQYRRRA